MAPHPKQIRLIKQRLENLEQEKEHFFGAVTKHVEPVISLAKTWIEKQEATGASFQQVRGAIERAIDYFFVGSIAPEEGGDETEEEKTLSARAEDDPGLSLPSFPVMSSTGTTLAASAQVSPASLDRTDTLENIGNKTSHEAHSTAADIKEVTQIVHRLEERICQLETEKEVVEGKVKTLEEKLQRAPAGPQRAEKFEGRLERLETGLIRVKKLEDRLRENDEQRKTDLKNIGDLTSKMAAFSAKIDTVKKRQRPPVGFVVRSEGSYMFHQNGQIMRWSQVLSNPGKYFDASTGIFTAPVDGLYHVKLEEEISVSQVNQHGGISASPSLQVRQYYVKYASGSLQVRQYYVKYASGSLLVTQLPVEAPGNAKEEWIVAEVSTVIRSPGRESDSIEVNLGMRAGDQLYVKNCQSSGGQYPGKNCMSVCTFYCVLVD